MATSKRRASVDDLSKQVSDLIEQIKVMVVAVDDLRCEVEWWARNAADQRHERESTERRRQDSSAPDDDDEAAEDAEEDECPFSSTESKGDDACEAESLPVASDLLPGESHSHEPSARERLAAMERQLREGPRGQLPEDWTGDDGQELPVGVVLPVDGELWSQILDLRPAHVIDWQCCCEEGIGAPYLLAWETEEGHFLRELTDDEAIAFQRVCLDAHRAATRPTAPSPPPETQLSLWDE